MVTTIPQAAIEAGLAKARSLRADHGAYLCDADIVEILEAALPHLCAPRPAMSESRATEILAQQVERMYHDTPWENTAGWLRNPLSYKTPPFAPYASMAIAAILSATAEARAAALEEAAKAIPNNWCDALLTGKTTTELPWGCPEIERLLNGVKNRIRALAADAEAKPQT